MELTDQELKRLQRHCLELLKEVDRICRKNDIEYALEGGTLLGAVRDGKFIPWDDDADVIMFRDEYDKFYKACKKDLDTGRFFFQEYRTDPEYPWGYSKLRLKNTEMIQYKQEHLKFHKGIFIDIFIYDGVPDDFFLRRLHAAACYAIRKCEYSVVGKIYAESPIMRGWYGLLDKIPKKAVFHLLEAIARKTNINDHVLSRHMTYPYITKQSKYGLPTRCFDSYTDIEFEGTMLRVMSGYDLYLRKKFGNYKKLPPVEKRKPALPIKSIRFLDEIQ